MIINYELNENSTFKTWQVYPITDDLPKLEIDNPKVIKLGKTKLINGKIVQPNEENNKNTNIAIFKLFRKKCLQAFDTWEKNVLRGREEDSESILEWYRVMLNYPTTINENTTREDYPTIPERIKYYL